MHCPSYKKKIAQRGRGLAEKGIDALRIDPVSIDIQGSKGRGGSLASLRIAGMRETQKAY